ncbi:hypothetical protein NFI96_026544, partial [Prochilodus magdalenae]
MFATLLSVLDYRFSSVSSVSPSWISFSLTRSVGVGCGDKMILTLQLLLLLTLTIRTDFTAGHYLSKIAECSTSSAELSDVELIYANYFNKDLLVQYNSSVGKAVGFGDFGVNLADAWNNGPALQLLQGELDRYCRYNLQLDFETILSKTVLPKIRLRSEQEAVPGRPAILMCSAYNFYPRAIDVYWLRNNKKLTTDSVFIEDMANGDWTYQIHSHLEYTPKSGEQISCVVDHVSSDQPIIYDWDPSLPDSEKGKIAAGAAGVMLGFVFAIAGFVYYKRKSSSMCKEEGGYIID